MGAGPLTQTELDNLKLEQSVTGEDTQTMTKRIFQDGSVAAAKAIVNLAIHSPNERTRLNAATYVVERNIGRVQDDPPKPVGDPFTNLWETLLNNAELDQNGDPIDQDKPTSHPQPNHKASNAPVESNRKDPI